MSPAWMVQAGQMFQRPDTGPEGTYMPQRLPVLTGFPCNFR
jgi:hypothetical protein